MEHARDRTRHQSERVIDLAPADQFRQLVAFIADGIVVVDQNGTVRLVNPAAEELLGRRAGDLIGRHFGFPLVTSESAEIEITRPDGSTAVVELRTAAIEWGGADGFVTSLRDVTERAHMAEQQGVMIERLQELDRLKNEFVSMVSHDLRSPMATIAGFADTLRVNWELFEDDRKKKMLERISENTSHLARFVENVLQVGQIEAGELSYELMDFDISALIHRVAAENMHPVHGVDVDHQIKVFVPEDLPYARADEIRQWQILTNLVANALKFSPAGTPIEINAVAGTTHVEISVRDRGLGIAPEDTTKLFRKFSRLERPEGMNIKGTGLGLYICKAMVEAQDGRIWVDSTPGKGSTFTYTVPRAA